MCKHIVHCFDEYTSFMIQRTRSVRPSYILYPGFYDMEVVPKQDKKSRESIVMSHVLTHHTRKMIFGHTHQPISWGVNEIEPILLPQLPEGEKFVMYNTGGWLNRENEKGEFEFCGAEIFLYDPNNGMRSVRIDFIMIFAGLSQS